MKHRYIEIVSNLFCFLFAQWQIPVRGLQKLASQRSIRLVCTVAVCNLVGQIGSITPAQSYAKQIVVTLSFEAAFKGQFIDDAVFDPVGCIGSGGQYRNLILRIDFGISATARVNTPGVVGRKGVLAEGQQVSAVGTF